MVYTNRKAIPLKYEESSKDKMIFTMVLGKKTVSLAKRRRSYINREKVTESRTLRLDSIPSISGDSEPTFLPAPVNHQL